MAAVERRRWRNRALVALVVVVGLAAFARFEKTTPLLLPMALLVCAVVAIGGLVLDVTDPRTADWEVVPDVLTVAHGQDTGLGGNVRMIENHLSARTEDTALPSRLAQMTEDRLRRLGLHRNDPGVRERLGPTLSAVLDGSLRTLRLSDVEECLRRMEELA